MFDWLRRRSANPAAAAVPAQPPTKDYRFLVLMEKPVFVELINQATPFAADHAHTLAEALTTLERSRYAAVLALSPMSEPGSAGRLIQAFRERNPGGLSIYHGWDYRIELSGLPAERCGADFLLVGGVLGEELVAFFPAVVELHQRGMVPPVSLEWYERALRMCFPRSPFWEVAERFRAGRMPPSEYE